LSPELIGQECFERFTCSVSIGGLTFGQIILGDESIDDFMRNIDGKVL
jgi:hypothetical protein